MATAGASRLKGVFTKDSRAACLPGAREGVIPTALFTMAIRARRAVDWHHP